MIRCFCGKLIFDGHILKVRIGQFGGGAMNLKCPQCKRWLEGIDARYLTGEIKEPIDFRYERRCVRSTEGVCPSINELSQSRR